jgi:hypothetical protein
LLRPVLSGLQASEIFLPFLKGSFYKEGDRLLPFALTGRTLLKKKRQPQM